MTKLIAYISAIILYISPFISNKKEKLPYSTNQKAYHTYEYKTAIKSIQLYPLHQNYDDKTKPAVVSLAQTIPLILEFDLLNDDYGNLYAKILHFDADWRQTNINELEYLNDFNEFPLNDYEYSFDTKKEFVHFRFEIPRVKISGNYKILVYEEGQSDTPLAEKAFIIYENATKISIDPQLPISSKARWAEQQIPFVIDYSGLNISNPDQDVKVVIRQNQREDNAITNLKPTFIRQSQSLLEYKHFNSENAFLAGNEFRFFDLRSLNFPGQNVGRVIEESRYFKALLMKDKDRSQQVYSQYNDLNGQYVINTADRKIAETEADYVEVNFFLEAIQVDGNVYVIGAFNDWQKNEESKMSYNNEQGYYTAKMNLKQGWYNYIYWVDSNNMSPYAFEGSHAQTENLYEIIVYFKPPGGRADRVIGYTSQLWNPRNMR